MGPPDSNRAKPAEKTDGRSTWTPSEGPRGQNLVVGEQTERQVEILTFRRSVGGRASNSCSASPPAGTFMTVASTLVLLENVTDYTSPTRLGAPDGHMELASEALVAV